MRLVEIGDDGQLTLTKDLSRDIPDYAILSHVWGKDEDEVTFADMINGTGEDRPGYNKLTFCRNQALKDALRYFWIDTCCIDKSNAVELSEAINSMFRWYSHSSRCYVYLSDVSTKATSAPYSDATVEANFRRSRWHTRGWTLQELLAPSSVEFFSKEGEFLGSKRKLKVAIHETTSIPLGALSGMPLACFPPYERMRWSDRRKTTKLEDKAYCLMGIFDVFMSPIYGEGDNAFVRLETAIAERCDRLAADMEARNPQTSRHSDAGKQDTSQQSARTDEELAVETEAEKVRLRDNLLRSLAFDQMHSRVATISRAYLHTCSWLLSHSSYRDWNDLNKLDKHGGLLWIKGKPGAGKSTLMKYAHASADRARKGQEILVSFFFNARGGELQKTTAGLYRSLLHQILKAAPELHELLDGYDFVLEQGLAGQGWTVELLSDLLFNAVGRLHQRPLKCFVDALDECDVQQVRDMVVFFAELREAAIDNGSRFQVCFASRHYPTIGSHDCGELILDDEPAHDQDLVRYVQGHLVGKDHEIMKEVRKEILEKADGVFLWVVLVVAILNNEYHAGRMEDIKERLREIPAGLSELFQAIIRRDQEDLPSFTFCLQLILYAQRPLGLEEFYFAMKAGLRLHDLASQKYTNLMDTDMKRFLRDCSKGFAELTKDRLDPTVQFIHESVPDFLIKDGGFRELLPGVQDFRSYSHERIRDCCNACLTPYLKGIDCAFSEYAIDQVLSHSQEAATTLDQDDFLGNFQLETWIQCVTAVGFPSYEAGTTLLYVLADLGYARLIKTVTRGKITMGKRGGEHYFPLFAALAERDRNAVRALFQQPDEQLIQDLFDALEKEYPPKSTISFRRYHTPLVWLLERGHTGLADLLLDCSDVDLKEKDWEGRDALSRIAEAGNEDGVLWLLSVANADVNSLDVKGLTSLMYAISKGREAIVQMLLENDANTEIKDPDGDTALMLAAYKSHTGIIATEQLLNSGATIEATNEQGQNALIIAARNGRKEIVARLLEAGANIEAADKSLKTACLHAAEQHQHAALKLLLDKNASLETRDEHGMTLLMLAGGDLKCIEGLLRVMKARGVDRQTYVDANNHNGESAITLATEAGYTAVVELLKAVGATDRPHDCSDAIDWTLLFEEWVRLQTIQSYFEKDYAEHWQSLEHFIREIAPEETIAALPDGSEILKARSPPRHGRGSRQALIV